MEPNANSQSFDEPREGNHLPPLYTEQKDSIYSQNVRVTFGHTHIFDVQSLLQNDPEQDNTNEWTRDTPPSASITTESPSGKLTKLSGSSRDHITERIQGAQGPSVSASTISKTYIVICVGGD